MLLESIVHNQTLELLDVSINHIERVKNLLKKEIDNRVTFEYIKTCFKYLKDFSPEKLKVNDWLLDYLEYPDFLTDDIKQVTSPIADKKTSDLNNSTMQ